MNWSLPGWAARDTDTAWRLSARRLAWLAALGALAIVALLGAYTLTLLPQAPGATELRQVQAARPSVLLSVDGQPLASFTRTQQEPVTLDQVSPHVLQALLATEDHRFYEHRGVDLRRTVSAMLRTLSGETQGGSTITQQLARNLFPEDIGRERNVSRKLKEMITALRIEKNYSKRQILEIYLNSAPFLYNVVGIEMAARTYCDKSAAELDVLESATLIGMLKGTAYYNPVLHPDRAKARRNVVLAQMAKHRMLPEAQYRKLVNAPLQVKLNRQPDVASTAPHFANQARRWLIDWADQHDYNLYADGLVVQTTLDSRLQGLATRAVEREAKALQAVADVEWAQPGARVSAGSPEAYEKARAKVDPFGHFWRSRRDLVTDFIAESPEFHNALAGGEKPAAALQRLAADSTLMGRLKHDKTRLEAGFMAIDPASGEIRAWVGSRDFGVDQFDHVVQAARQPGSTFKPFVYGAALEAGIGPERSYVDDDVEIPLGNGKVWRPTDMGGPPSGAPMTLRDGLIYSKNTITAQVSQDVGIPRIVALAQAMGVDQSKLDPVPSLALGTSPVTLYEMVSAYATIARQGRYHKPLMIKRITDRHGTVLADFGAEMRQALSSDSAVELIDMMRGVVARGTGTLVKSRFGISADVAGKTGTTQNNTDGWFILMHPKLVAGAWVGFNDSRVTMRSNYWGQGGHNAVLLVGDFFRDVLKSGLLEAKASFPPSRRPVLPPPPPSQAFQAGESGALLPSDEARLRSDDPTELAPPGAVPAEVVVRRDGSRRIVIGDRAGVQAMPPDGPPPKSAEELGRVMNGMGRDPATGAPRGASSGATNPHVLPALPPPPPPPAVPGTEGIRSPEDGADPTPPR